MKSARGKAGIAGRALVAVALAISGAVATSAYHAPPAAAEVSIPIVGHGWGHGRGMGQWGSLGYALDNGWNYQQITDHFYGGTALSAGPANAITRVLMKQFNNVPTIVYLESGTLTTTADSLIGGAGVRKAVHISWQGGTAYRIMEGLSCGGPWVDRGVVSLSEVVISSSIASDDRNTMLQLCEIGFTRYVRGQVVTSAFSTVFDGLQQRTMNSVRVEDYLRSVVPGESPASWAAAPPAGGGAAGLEALRSQAVAARSYVLAGDTRWGLAQTCNDVFCQVYYGYGTLSGSTFTPREFAASDQAVAETNGLVRMSGTTVARTEFSASTGGWTAPSFPAVVDEGDDVAHGGILTNPNHTWTATLSSTTVETKFDTAAGKDLGTYQSLAVTARNGYGDWGGRVLTIVGYFSGGSYSMSGSTFASTFGLKSNWFTLQSPNYGPFATAEDFVAQQYRDFLNREPDSAGLQFWSGALTSLQITPVQLVEMFLDSPEFGAQLAPITRLYFAAYDRFPDAGGLAYWIGRFQAGMPISQIAEAFVSAPEFQARYGSLDNSAFVDVIYQNALDRAPDQAGHDYWVGKLNAGLSRGDMVVFFSESAEFVVASKARVDVTMIYVGMLRRTPDQGGFDYWLTQGRTALIEGVLASAEYAARFD